MKLDNACKLNHKFSLYIPATCDVNCACDNTAIVNAVAARFSTWFGGASAMPINGFWLSDLVGLVKENTVIVYAFCDADSFKAHIDDVATLAENIRDTMKQEAVSLEVDGELYFI